MPLWGPGDAVFTTPFTFIATTEAVRILGGLVGSDPASNCFYKEYCLKKGAKKVLEFTF